MVTLIHATTHLSCLEGDGKVEVKRVMCDLYLLRLFACRLSYADERLDSSDLRNGICNDQCERL